MPVVKAGRFVAQRPWIISITCVVALGAWLYVGTSKAEEENAETQTSKVEIPLAKVGFQTFKSEPTAQNIELYGRTAPNRDVQLKAEIAGRVDSLKIAKGDMVKAGQVIALIDQRDLPAQLDQAKAILKVKQKEFDASSSLKKRGLQTEVAFTAAEAELATAKAAVASVQDKLKHSIIRAPFSGIVNDLNVELGDYLASGDPVAHLIDLSKLVIEADLSERHIRSVSRGQAAAVKLHNGDKLEGTLRYVARNSSITTNTFPVEIEIDNSQQLISSGVSAEVTLSLKTQDAVKVTPAMLALDEEGNLGVKTLKDDRVHFVGIQLVKAEQDGVWLSGLGSTVDIVTVGQGFVRDGDQVIAVRQ
jgi:multidrug efflux system membrane fusion protein